MPNRDIITVQLSVEDSACVRYQLARNASQCRGIAKECVELALPGADHWLKKASELTRISRLFPDFREGRP